MEQKLKSLTMNKKGLLGLDTVKGVIMFFLILTVTAVAVFLALSSLQQANLFPNDPVNANNTAYIIENVTGGTVQFFENVPTIMLILGAVVIVLTVSLIIFAVNRFAGTTGSSSI